MVFEPRTMWSGTCRGIHWYTGYYVLYPSAMVDWTFLFTSAMVDGKLLFTSMMNSLETASITRPNRRRYRTVLYWNRPSQKISDDGQKRCDSSTPLPSLSKLKNFRINATGALPVSRGLLGLMALHNKTNSQLDQNKMLCQPLLSFLPLIKVIPQFLTKGFFYKIFVKSHLREV